MKKSLLLLSIILASTSLSGCQFKDIDKRAFVLAIGIDRPENIEKQRKYEVTLKIAVPEGDPAKRSQASINITETAESVPEAIRLMKSRIDKEIDFSHCKVIVFGESFARDNLTPIVDWSSRRRDIQLIMLCAIGVPNARKVIETQPRNERLPGNALILSLGKEGSESPFTSTVYSFDLRRRVKERGIDPIMPIVEARNPDLLISDKTALFNKKKLVEILTTNETRLLNLLRSSNFRTSFHVMAEGTAFDYNLETFHSKYKIKERPNGQTTIQYRISGRAVTEESESGVPVDAAMMKAVSKAASEKLERDVMQLFKKIQASGLDPLGWGLRYSSRHWNNETEQQDWERLYPGLEFQVNADLEIKYTGMIL
ncbi:Ger(x)C family spore germination protein [Paenibacillus sp. M1]|uniref:Ger(X)C family spore germination protein n=1 Tax=Paenibacillus haidiansis TaxID=1574488 RepID=A0ABU7VV39_9BACL